jgi:hypothetical protein
MRLSSFFTLALLPLTACTVSPLGSEGRPCPCGPETKCDPATNTCVKGQSSDGLRFPDTTTGDGTTVDLKPPDLSVSDGLIDDATPDQLIAGDLPACFGLTCPLGCNTQEKRCNRLDPSNVDVKQAHDMATAALSPSGTDPVVFDTDSGKVTQGGQVLRPGGDKGQVEKGIYWDQVSQASGYPEIGLFAVASFSLPAGVEAQVVGKRAFALYASGDITIAGTLTGAAVGETGGPGGFAGGHKNGAAGAACFGGEGKGGFGGGTPSDQSGGGGGGFGGAGGAGGSGLPSPPGGAGGTVAGNITLAPLRGGCGGGAGGGPDTGGPNGDGGYGGGGGGVLQLAASGTIKISGVVSAPGAGGGGGTAGAAGGGGGSGGGLLLEAGGIVVSGTLAANGGGGGSGSDNQFNSQTAPSGKDGQPSTYPALGGPTNPPYGGSGGAGGALGSPAANGENEVNGGGGGGGAGRIRLAAPSLSKTAKISPPATTSKTVGTW